ncbi:TPA: fimbrial protein [Salmonella enterica subsp. diarizonae serovar 61:l,v:z35]
MGSLSPVEEGFAADATFNASDITLGTSGATISAQNYSMDNVPFIYNTNYTLGKSDSYKYNYGQSYQCSGLDAQVNLPVVGTINSQSIYGITDEIGVVVWAGDTAFSSARPMSGNSWTNVFNNFCTGSSQGTSVYVRPVILKRNTSGMINIPYTTIGSIRIRNMSGGTYYGKTAFTFSLNSMTIINGAKSCTLMSGQNVTVPLNTISLMSIPSAGSELQGGTTSISLNCQTGVSVFATLTDATTPSNTSNLLSLTPDSTATGVGLRLYKNNDSTPLSFGPDSPVKGNLNQWRLSAGTEAMPSVVLRANYVNTNGTPTAGTVNGVTTITFSYQ